MRLYGQWGIFYAFLAAGFAGYACESKSTIKAEGEARVKHVVTIEFGVCDTIEDPLAKMECVKALLDILKEVTAEKAVTPGN